jgi:anti-sigma factor ChrR (cupin superfamily)
MEERGYRHHELDALAAYALDALDAPEQASLATHLATCAACRHALSELRLAASLLPYSLCEVEPPAHLRRQILAAARRTLQAPPRE